MSGSIKSKKFYSTGFIPLSNDETRKSQGLQSQLVSNLCVNKIYGNSLNSLNNKKENSLDNNNENSLDNNNDNSLDNVMYPSSVVKLTYNLPVIPANSSCLRYLKEI
jgi:hypothetical protein